MRSSPIVTACLITGRLLYLVSLKKFILLIHNIVIMPDIFVGENFWSILRRYYFLFLFCEDRPMIWCDRRPLYVVHLEHCSFWHLLLCWLNCGNGYDTASIRCVVIAYEAISTITLIEFRCNFDWSAIRLLNFADTSSRWARNLNHNTARLLLLIAVLLLLFCLALVIGRHFEWHNELLRWFCCSICLLGLLLFDQLVLNYAFDVLRVVFSDVCDTLASRTDKAFECEVIASCQRVVLICFDEPAWVFSGSIVKGILF